MPSDRKPSLMRRTAVMTAVVALAGYIGAYYSMLGPVQHWSPDGWQPDYCGKTESDSDEVKARYDWEKNRRWQRFFAPIHWVDRHCIHPHEWAND